MGKENRARWLGLLKEGGSLGQYPTSATMLKRKEKQDVWELPGQCRLSLPLGQSGPTQQEVQSKLSKWWAWPHFPLLWGKWGRGEMVASFLKNAFYCSLTPPTQDRGWKKPEEELFLTFLLQKVRLVVVPLGFLRASLKCARGTQKWEGDIRLTYPARTIDFAHLEVFFEHQILAFIFFLTFCWIRIDLQDCVSFWLLFL